MATHSKDISCQYGRVREDLQGARDGMMGNAAQKAPPKKLVSEGNKRS